MAVNKDGALLRLLLGMSADINKRLDDVVKGVHIVIEKYQLAAVVFKYCGFFFGLWTYVWFVLFQFLILYY